MLGKKGTLPARLAKRHPAFLVQQNCGTYNQPGCQECSITFQQGPCLLYHILQPDHELQQLC